MLSKLLRLYIKAKFKPWQSCSRTHTLKPQAVLPPSCQGKIELSYHQYICPKLTQLFMFSNRGNRYLDILMEDNPFMICICIWNIMIFYSILDRYVWSTNSHKYMEPSHKGLSQVEIGNYLSLFIICLSLKLQIACLTLFNKYLLCSRLETQYWTRKLWSLSQQRHCCHCSWDSSWWGSHVAACLANVGQNDIRVTLPPQSLWQSEWPHKFPKSPGGD